MRGSLSAVLGALVATTSLAVAQPADPYAGTPAPDPALNEQIATALVKRAQELYDARVYADAKQLAVEALAKSPAGAAGEQAKFLIASIDRQLGIAPEPPRSTEPPGATGPASPLVPSQPVAEPPRTQAGPVDTSPEGPEPWRASRMSSAIHAGIYFGVIGATIGAFTSENDDGSTDASGPILLGLVAGGVAAVALPGQIAKLDWSEGQVRTAGSLANWAGVAGGFFGDIADTDASNARQILVGASVGATAGLLAGAALAQRDRYTAGDIALVDTLAGIGTVGGLTLGMLMQPAKDEAYSLNAALGAGAGVVAGLVAAPETNTTPRRMARVAGLAAVGGALPFLLYAAAEDGSTDSDERWTGALSSIGLVAGAYLGFRLTRDMDVDRDVKPVKRKAPPSSGDPDAPMGPSPSDVRPVVDAPISLLSRRSDGHWSLGTLSVQPLSQRLAPQRGVAVPLVGAAF